MLRARTRMCWAPSAVAWITLGVVRWRSAYRFAMGLAVATAFVLTWVNFVLMADVNPANVMYFGVLVIGLVGAAIARFRARNGARVGRDGGCSNARPVRRTCFLEDQSGSRSGGPVLGLNGLFIVLFAISALWFRRAARTHEMPATRSV